MSKYQELIDLTRNDGSIITNKNLIFSIGRYPAEIFTELLSLQKFYYEENKLTDDGYFYCTIDRMYLNTGLKKDAQNTAINTLVDKRLIKKEKRGLPPTRHFKVIATEKQLLKYIENGRQKRKKESKRLAKKSGKDVERYMEYLNKQAKNPDKSKMADLPKNNHRKDRRTNIEESAVNNTNVNNTEDNTYNKVKGSFAERTMSFQEYLIITNEEVDNTIKQAIEYYLSQYKVNFNKKHTDLTYSKWDDIVYSMNEIYDEEYNRCREFIPLQAWIDMIDLHFQNDYKEGCDYHLPHFTSDKVMRNRYYDAGGVF